MKKYSAFEAPIKVFGIPFFEETKTFDRIPAYEREKLPNPLLGKRAAGARIGFKTDASEFTVKVTLKTLFVDIGMSLFAAQGIPVMIGERQKSKYAGVVFPPDYDTKVYEKTFTKDPVMEDVTLWVLRNEEIENIEIFVPEDATVLEPTPYKHGVAVYYGSSITEGGCSTLVTNSYVALLSRWLDLDYIDLGFSGNAKGETEVADYINKLDMKVFVMDYDHNAPDVAHLENTHEAFFKRIRELNPTLPVLFMTRPNFDYSPDAKERREVVKTTYLNALKNGDKNVYFIDGETLFGDEDRELCTVDRIHPNDLGFYKMAKTILPVMKKILNIC